MGKLLSLKRAKIDVDKNWHWICFGENPDHCVFSCKEATRSKTKALAIVAKRNISEKDGVWYIKSRPEHPDRDFKQYQCPACKNLMSDRELDATWDWSGPHCDECGCTGMNMFSAVTEHAPVISGRNIINQAEEWMKQLKGIFK